MWCGLCGFACHLRDGARRSTGPLSLSGGTLGDLLTELGHSVLEGALLCPTCHGLVEELDESMKRAAITRDKIAERALLKAENDVRREKLTKWTQCDLTKEGKPGDKPTETVAVTNGTQGYLAVKPKDEPTEIAAVKDEPARSLPMEGPETGSEATQAAPRTRRHSRRMGKAAPTQPGQLYQEDGEGTRTGPAEVAAVERVMGMSLEAGDGAGDGVSRVDAGAVKDELMEAGDPMDESGGGGGCGGGGHGATADPDVSGSGVGHDLADSGGGCEHLTSKVSKRPDWNERWRSRALRNMSWWDRGDTSGPFSHCKRTLVEAGQAELPEHSSSSPIEPAAGVKTEPGTEPAGRACSSTGAPARPPLDQEVARVRTASGESMFRVGRKVVTKQRDGSAMPAVKVVRQDRRGQPKVAFVDHRKALRQAARLDCIRDHESQIWTGARTNEPAVKRKPPPPKRKRPPRVLTKPSGQGSSEVGWMAPGAAGVQPWLEAAAEGAVHAVLEVQPGEEWVDAIVRSEAAEDSGQGWTGGEGQMPVPLADIKAEPLE